LDALIRRRAAGRVSARLVAGFCWPWSDPDRNGKLVDDVEVGAWRRPWNARSDAGRLASGIPPSSLWASDPGGMEQVGCVYTAQGFEFDYVGVIWGPDIVYRFDNSGWIGDKTASHDGKVKPSRDRFAELVKNTYRVLLSRGLKGCYVYFVDKETERFVRSRMEVSKTAEAPVVVLSENPKHEALPFRKLDRAAVEPFVNSVPLVDLKFAAGAFGDVGSFDVTECDWVELPSHFRPQPGLFVAQVMGESMNRRIPNGSWCLFKANPVGTKQGKIVVAQHRSVYDPDLGGSFTVKIYTSEKHVVSDDSWRHVKVVLSPDSDASSMKAIEIRGTSAAEVRIVAEFVSLLE
jgi:uncharacterized protein